MHLPGRFTIGAVLKAAQRGLAGPHGVAFERRLQRGIRAQLLVVIQVFIAQRQSIDTLANHTERVVFAAGTSARVVQCTGHCVGQGQLTIDLSKQQRAVIRSDGATVKTGLHAAAFKGWKFEASLGTLCHGRGPVRCQRKQLKFIELSGPCPLYWCNIQASAEWSSVANLPRTRMCDGNNWPRTEANLASVPILDRTGTPKLAKTLRSCGSRRTCFTSSDPLKRSAACSAGRAETRNRFQLGRRGRPSSV